VSGLVVDPPHPDKGLCNRLLHDRLGAGPSFPQRTVSALRRRAPGFFRLLSGLGVGQGTIE
jgi:hypothetical protein